ncbi:uncharacterized protein LOC129234449 [Uloborus diversus]|uniref:uncharacterized protein LOC129234449 n=1 Tax=Uloborus diversus TaxID=327109 RepID=UPI0024093A41|nr:uncharacterized protein LOC129234449 [Uloborus diversus]
MEKNGCRSYGKNTIIINTVYASEVRKNEIVIPSNASVLDVKLFEDEEVYLIILFNSGVLDEKIYIYEYKTENNSWSIQQMFHSNTPLAYDLISEEGGRFPFRLAVASKPPNSSISVYAWVEKKFELFVYHTKPAISAVLWVQTEKELCLLLARANTTLLKDNGQVQTSLEVLEVLALADDLILDHTVSIHNVNTLKRFYLAGEVFVLACSRQLQVIYMLQLRGQNGFQIVQEVPAPGVTGAVVFTTEDDDVMLAVSSDTGHTRILKAMIKGERFLED